MVKCLNTRFYRNYEPRVGTYKWVYEDIWVPEVKVIVWSLSNVTQIYTSTHLLLQNCQAYGSQIQNRAVSWLSTWLHMSTRGQSQCLIFVQGHSDLYFQTSSAPKLPVEAKFSLEPLWIGGVGGEWLGNDAPTLTVTFLMTQSDLVSDAFLWENA